MAGLDPAIHIIDEIDCLCLDGRLKAGHDQSPGMRNRRDELGFRRS
jgi:hypothetical protein